MPKSWDNSPACLNFNLHLTSLSGLNAIYLTLLHIVYGIYPDISRYTASINKGLIFWLILPFFQVKTEVHKNCDHPEFNQELHVPFQVNIPNEVSVSFVMKFEIINLTYLTYLRWCVEKKNVFTLETTVKTCT